MTYLHAFQQGYQTFPAALLFRFKDLFPSAKEFLVWQFFYFQNTSHLDSLAPSEVAQATGFTVAEVNQSIETLQEVGLLDVKTISIAGEIELLFDSSPALAKLDSLFEEEKEPTGPQMTNDFKSLVADFERELGRFLSPFELEDLKKTVDEDSASVELVRAALREAVFNNKTNWRYIQAILRNWRREGITNVTQVEAKQAEREAPLPKSHKVSSDFLDAMNMWKE